MTRLSGQQWLQQGADTVVKAAASVGIELSHAAFLNDHLELSRLYSERGIGQDVVFRANIENEWTYDTLKALTNLLGTTDLNFDQSYSEYGSEWTGRYHTGANVLTIRWSK